METKKESKRLIVSRRALIFWTLFISIGAFLGGICMLVDPSGKIMKMDALLPYFQVLPFADKLFQNYVFPGIALIVVNGITNLVAAALTIAKKKVGYIFGGVFGLMLMAWITIQFVIFPTNAMSTLYFVFGLMQAATGSACYIGSRQSEFVFNENDYKNVGTKNELVVFFSRTGYTKKLAYETANESGAAIYEIKTKERINGDSGFWWCGRFGSQKLPMPIEELSVDLAAYEKVTICFPVWVFDMCAPMRSFFAQAKGKIKNAEYVSVHFMNAPFEKIKKEADEMLSPLTSTYKSVVMRFGRVKK